MGTAARGEQRIRLPLEVLAAVRGAGRIATFPVGCRMLAEDCIESGSTVEDAEYFAQTPRGRRDGLHFLVARREIRGRLAAKNRRSRLPYTGRSGYECMPSYYSDAKGHLAAMSTHAHASVRKSARLDSTRPSCSPAAYIILIRRNRRCTSVQRT